MHFINDCRRVAAALGLTMLAACAPPRAPSTPAAPADRDTARTGLPPATARPPMPATAPPLVPDLAAPVARARNWDEYTLLAGRRLIAANPNATYTDAVPEPLLAIPVLEIELNGDGSLRRVSVQRQPTQARDTVQLAIDAVHRAAPFGDVSHLPRPWKFSEVFLFRDDRRFKPRALDR